MSIVDDLRRAGEIGGRTVQINRHGEPECRTYEPAPLQDGHVRIRTILSAISPGTEMTYLGRSASNVHLRKRWDPELRLFRAGSPALEHPVTFGYRAAGEVVDAASTGLEPGTRVYGNWRHTELVAMPAERAAMQRVPDGLSWEDAIDIGQMGPICVNAAAFGEAEIAGHPAVVIGAGPVGLITAQVVRASGAGPVHVIDRLPGRLAVAAEIGFATRLADGQTDVAADLKGLYGSDGIPVAWECSGAIAGLHEAIRVVRRQGTVVAVGFYQGEAAGLALGDEFHHNAVRIISAQIGNPFPGLDRQALQARTIELALSSGLRLGSLPRLTLPVEDVAEAFEALRRPDEVLQVALRY